MKKRLISIFLLSMLSALLIASPVLAYLFSAPVTVTETNGTAYTMLAAQDTLPTPWLISHGYVDANALDTAVTPTKPHMVANDRLLLATPVAAYGQVNANFTTGNTPATSMDVITGYNGYVTVIDDAVLEPGNNFSLVVSDAYLNTAVGATKNIVNKAGALIVYTDPVVASTVVATIPDYTSVVTVTAVNDAPSGSAGYAQTITATATVLINRLQIYCTTANFVNFVVGLYATVGGAPTGTPLSVSDPVNGVTGNWIVFPITPYTITNGVQYAVVGISGTGNVGATGTNPYAGGKIWSGITFGAGNVIVGGAELAGGVWDEDLKIDTAPYCSVSGVTSGEHDVTVSLTGGSFSLTVDAIAPSTYAFAGAVPDTANNWIIGQTNVMPYFGDYSYTVGGVLMTHYAPVTTIGGQTYSVGTVTVTNGDATVTGAGGAAWTNIMNSGLFKSADGVYYTISSVTSGTTLELSTVYGGGTLGAQAYNMYVKLPDRQGTEQPGIITWGANPAGTAMVIASFASYGGTFSDTTDTTPPDRLTEVPVSDWYGDGTITKAATLVNPFRGLVLMVSDNTSLTEIQTWRWYGIGILVVAVALFAKLARGHQGITSIAAGAVIALLIAFDASIFPLYLAVLSAGLMIGGVISERSHQI